MVGPYSSRPWAGLAHWASKHRTISEVTSIPQNGKRKERGRKEEGRVKIWEENDYKEKVREGEKEEKKGDGWGQSLKSHLGRMCGRRTVRDKPRMGLARA